MNKWLSVLILSVLFSGGAFARCNGDSTCSTDNTGDADESPSGYCLDYHPKNPYCHGKNGPTGSGTNDKNQADDRRERTSIYHDGDHVGAYKDRARNNFRFWLVLLLTAIVAKGIT